MTYTEVRAGTVSIKDQMKSWNIARDMSIDHPEGCEDYDFYPIEIKAPIYTFTPASIQAVKQVCLLFGGSISSLLKRTVEFIQQEATLYPERVAHWIQLCVGLVELAGKVDRVELEIALRSTIDSTDEEAPVTAVLEWLGFVP